MFYPRYNYSRGLVRPASRRVAALSKTRRPMMRKAFGDAGGIGGLQGAGGGNFQAYSPVYERAEDPTLAEEFLPTDTQTQNKIFRNIIAFDPVAGPATEYWRDLAFSRHVRLGAMEDEKIRQFYEDAIEASGIEEKMKWLLNDYLIFGRVVAQLEMDERKGYWTSCIVHDLDYVEIQLSLSPSDDPIINIQPTNEQRNWAVSRDPRAVEQRKRYDPELVKLIALGDAYPLPAEHTIFLPRQVYATDYYGTSYLTRIIPFKIMEKALIDAEISAARRRAGPVWVINVPDDYEAEMIQDIIDQFFAVEEDPIGGKVAVREGVNVTPLGGGKADFWTLSDEYEFLKTAKLNALGISQQFLDGEASYSSMEKVLHVFVEKLRSTRNYFTEKVIIDKMFKTLARMHGFHEKSKTQVAHQYRIARRNISDAELVYPTVEWDQPLEPEADLDKWELLERLEQKNIPVMSRTWAQAAGYDLDAAFDSAQSEIEDRAKIYQIKGALAEQADKAGFDMEGNYIAGGEIGAGPPGLGEDLGFGGPEEFELGPGEEFETAPALETPPPTPELPAPEAPPEEGAGAALDGARFPVRRPRQHRRVAAGPPHQVDQLLQRIALWDDDGQALGLHRQHAAKILANVAKLAPQQRNARYLQRYFLQRGLPVVQAGVLQYCAARLGLVKTADLGPDTTRYIEHVLVDKANKIGVTAEINHELEQLAKISRNRPKSRPGQQYEDKLSSTEVLTGIG